MPRLTNSPSRNLLRLVFVLMLPAGLLATTIFAPSLGGQVLKTGQTNCYDINGNQIPCAGTGQDGALQEGVAQSYTDNGNGTITDNVTGLMWEALDQLTYGGNPSDIHDAGNSYTTWASAFQKIADLNSANFAGYTDWRLPNVNELHSLIFFATAAPAVVPSAFNNGTDSFTYPIGSYWSSTTDEGEPFYAYGVSFTVGADINGLKTSATNFFVRAVRGPVVTPTAGVLNTGQGGQCWDSSGNSISCAGTGQDGESQIGVARSYTDNGNGTITDNGTGLMWEELENVYGTENLSDPTDVDNNYTTWNLAFQNIADLNAANFAGYSDWRMPNIKEIQTLKNYGELSPTIDLAFNNGTDSFTQPSGYWSSTTSLSNPGWAYGENFYQVGGTFPTLFKTNPFANGSVRAVRGPLPPPTIIPPTEISTTASGLVYSRVTKMFVGTVTITNISSSSINGPVQVDFTSLPGGVTLSNATGSYGGNPYITAVPSGSTLAPGASATIAVQFSNPSNVTITATPVIYSGSL
jgi:hypothetical protein